MQHNGGELKLSGGETEDRVNKGREEETKLQCTRGVAGELTSHMFTGVLG